MCGRALAARTCLRVRNSAIPGCKGWRANWQLSPIIRIQSGLDANLLSGKDYALNGTIGQTATNGIQRPNLICASSQLSSFTQSIHEWFSTPCYTPNGTGQLGNVGKNTIRGPDMIVVNVALSRKFPIREAQYLEFRAEAYNLPNLVNFALSTSSTLMNQCSLRADQVDCGDRPRRAKPAIPGSCRSP
jgi:hypothetical protein